MSGNALKQLLLLVATFTLLISGLSAQEPTGGGSLIRDITGGGGDDFPGAKDPVVQIANTISGGKTKGKNQPKRPVRKQDPVLARANAARSASKPRYQEAEDQYRLATQIAPDDARAFAGLGNVYVDQQRFAEATDAYQQALKVNSAYSQVLLPLAFSLARMNRYEEAIEIYQQAIKADPANPEVHNNLSFAYNHTNRFQEAVDASQQAIKLLGTTGEAYTQGYQERNEILSYAYKNLGNAFNGLKRYDEAANSLKRAAEIEPKNVSAHFNLGMALYNAGRYSEAIEAYKEAIKLRPNLAQAHFNLGLTYLAISDKKQAMDEYEVLKTINPDLAAKLHSVIK